MTFVERFPRFRPSRVQYVLPVCLVAASTAAFFYSERVLSSPFLISFMGAVGISALFGFIPGFIAGVLATLASDFFFIPPILQLNLDHSTWLAGANYGLALVATRAGAGVLRRTGRDQKVKLALYQLLQNVVNGHNGHRRVLGRLDGHTAGEIEGWAFDKNEPLRPPKLAVYVDGRARGEVLPVWHRDDVGPHCFYFDLSGNCPPGPARVDVEFSDGQPLPNSPLTIDIPLTSAGALRETVLFMHIPKTAGTAFREAIVGNYKRSQVAYLYPDPPGFLPCDFGSLPLEQRANFRLVLGHYHFGMHHFLPQPTTYVTIVRNPVRRVISHFLYLIEQEEPGSGAPPSLLAELLERGGTINLDNLMVRCFSGVRKSEVPPGQITRDVYDLAVHNLRTSFKFVGYQERADDAYAAMQVLFGWHRQGTLNVVNRLGRQDERFEPVRGTIEHFNRWDCQLYAEICRLFPEDRIGAPRITSHTIE